MRPFPGYPNRAERSTSQFDARRRVHQVLSVDLLAWLTDF
jgi:hypothetical protein